jgi:hypothetical protein
MPSCAVLDTDNLQVEFRRYEIPAARSDL